MFKNYQGPDHAALMRQIKEEIGADAVIIDQRRLGRGYEVMVKCPAPVAADAAAPALPPAALENGHGGVPPEAARAAAATRAGQLLMRRVDALHAPPFGTKQQAELTVGRRVVDIVSNDRVLPPVVSPVAAGTAAARPLTYGAGGATHPPPVAGAGATPAVTVPPAGQAGVAASPAGGGTGETWQAIRALQSKMEELMQRQHGPGQSLMAQMLVHLQEQDIAPEMARKLCADFSGAQVPGQVEDYHAVCERLTAVLVRAIDFGAAVEPLALPACALVLMGPTGVGKTTTAIKLAARYKLTGQRRVAMLNIDAARLGGSEVLRQYAENVLNVPYEVAGTAAEAAAAWSRLRDYDTVIIDTAGCPPHKQRRLDDLRAWLDALDSDRQTRLLVMSATAKGRDLHRIAENFRAVRYDQFVFTKLDETTSVGNLFALMQSTRVPALYVTNGQAVTGDLDLLCPLKLARGISSTLPRF